MTGVEHPQNGFTLAITSGKGGVGKTSIALNLAIQLSRLQTDVLLIDVNFGLANLGVLLNLVSEDTLEDVLEGRCALFQTIKRGPEGLNVIPASLSSSQSFSFTPLKQKVLTRQLGKLKEKFDLILIDTPSGMSTGVSSVLSVADETVVITTPEPTAVVDAYAMVKLIHNSGAERRLSLLINMVKSRDQALDLKAKFDQMTNRFLNCHLVSRGCVLFDPGVAEAVWRQVPFVVRNANAPASLCLAEIAKGLLEEMKVKSSDGEMGVQYPS
ncbi:MAG: hypothetical protein B1H40_04885 [Candidatus Latescibacteria bacterium 4484_181]|nr:MAG: hypothetical protein B1H40_04885 [Candidatus Latescibacteria bacterium 4484_181]